MSDSKGGSKPSKGKKPKGEKSDKSEKGEQKAKPIGERSGKNKSYVLMLFYERFVDSGVFIFEIDGIF